MVEDGAKKRQRANGLPFPAAEPEYRAARQRCAESCAKYNDQAEFSSPEARARLWQAIVAPRSRVSSPDRIANESQIEKQTGHNGTSQNSTAHPPADITDDEALSGPRVLASDSSHSPEPAHALKRSPVVSTSPEARPAVTPPPSPEYKESRSQNPIVVNGEEADDDYAIADTPPPSRKASVLKINRSEATHAPPSDQQEHDPAVTNPFIVNAPYVKPPVYIDYGANLHIGNGTFINRNFVVIDSPVCPIRIGERCLFGPNVILAAVEHPLDADKRVSPIGAPSYASSIEIGNDCWIAAGVKILCGVKIGNGCVIGAGSVVTKDIPDGCIAYGNPARVKDVCSPRYHDEAKRLAGHSDVFEKVAAVPPTELIRAAEDRQPPKDPTCSNGCTFRCSPQAGGQNYNHLLQRGKDAVLLLIGLASLVHLINGWS